MARAKPQLVHRKRSINRLIRTAAASMLMASAAVATAPTAIPPTPTSPARVMMAKTSPKKQPPKKINPATINAHFKVVSNQNEPSVITTDTIRWQLQRINPAMQDLSAPIMAACQRHGVDPAYLVAKWNAESNCGKAGIAVKTKSVGNIRYTPPAKNAVSYTNYKGFRSYVTIEEAIEDFCRLTRQYNEKRGLSTVGQITSVWTPKTENKVDQHQEVILSLMRNMYRHQSNP